MTGAARGGHSRQEHAPPRPSRRVQWLFSRYARRYLRKSFHALRVSNLRPLVEQDETPVILFMNHASWWDPLVGAVLTPRLAPGRRAYAPIDAAALERYRFFARIGFFGVTQGSLRGAREFLLAARAICRRERTVLWLTPQGRFADVRERPPRLAEGLGHLAARLERASFVPLAVEYGFWEERYPEVFVLVGDEAVAGGAAAPREWTARFTAALERAQESLARLVCERRAERFEVLVEGRAGVGLVYDAWRALRATITGKPFQRRHGRSDR